MELRQRKKIRLEGYDYSQPGCYFITACVQGRAHLLGEIETDRPADCGGAVGRDDPGAPSVPIMRLSQYGRIVEKCITAIPSAYPNISVDQYVVMPNHIHFILRVENWESGAPGSSRPTQLIPRIMSALKRFSNQEAGFAMWQTSYYDHIIRSEAEYGKIWDYIETNPARWREDIYYAVPKGEMLL